MSHELICRWLDLPPDGWPPDHYRLLGLTPGEADAALIEQRVHQRLDAVRRYQLTHPGPATEAMNRLAQAFVCLTEPAAKQAYDSALVGRPPWPAPEITASASLIRPAPAAPPSPSSRGSVPPLPPPLPPPPSLPPPLPPPAPVMTSAEAVDLPEQDPPPAPAPPPPPPPSEPPDPAAVAAVGPAARRGLGSRAALMRRRRRTHELLVRWQRLRPLLEDPERRLTRGEAEKLLRLVEEVRERLDNFPLLGEAGEAGYVVIALVTRDSYKDVQRLDASQRTSLKRDWEAGKRFLESHRALLRRELRVARRTGRAGELLRRLRSVISDQPAFFIILLLALLALTLGLIPL